MSIYTEVFEEINEDIPESIKFETSNRFISESLSNKFQISNRFIPESFSNAPDPQNVLSKLILKKLLFLSRKQQLSTLSPNPSQKPSTLFQAQIQKLNSSKPAPISSFYKQPVNIDIVSKLQIQNTIASIKESACPLALQQENKVLKSKLSSFQQQDLIKRQFYKLKSKELLS